MSKTTLCEALYALPDHQIVKRRKSLFTPVVMLIVGIALIVASSLLRVNADLGTLRSTLILFGGCFSGVGVVLMFLRYSNSGFEPYHRADCCFLRREELKFQKEQRSAVLDLLSMRDFTTLRNLPSEGISALSVVVYYSPKSNFCAAQAFDYSDFESKPIGDIVITK